MFQFDKKENSLETLEVPTADAPQPSTNKNFVRLYGHHLCPFVEKTRLTLSAHNVQYQKVDVDLGKKTPWHLALNGGLVPILELQDGTLINESKVIMDFVEEQYPNQGYKTLPDDAVLRAKGKLANLLIE